MLYGGFKTIVDAEIPRACGKGINERAKPCRQITPFLWFNNQAEAVSSYLIFAGNHRNCRQNGGSLGDRRDR
jgi:hypothetical protein